MPKRVLVIDAIATNRIRFAALLESARYVVQTASGTSDVQGSPRDQDVVILGLPDERPGRAVTRVLAALQGAEVPVLCLDVKNEPLRRLLVLRAGARDVLPSKSPDDLLLSRLRGLIREGEAEREAERRRITAASFGFSEQVAEFGSHARIVCIGNLGPLADRLSSLLPHEVVHVPSEFALEEDALSIVPDAVLLDTGSERRALSRLLPDLRDRTHLSPVPVMAVYPEKRSNMAIHALALGASEIVSETAGVEEIELRINRMLARKAQNDALRRSDEQSYRLAATDPLTGLYNRRYAETYLCGLASRVDGQRSGFCLVLVDLDHFKRINDTHGHAAGDRVLCEVAHRLQANLRACDLIARYGGEEFMVVLPETSVAMARQLAERLRCAVSARRIPASDDQEIEVTASIGVAAGTLDNRMFAKRNGTFDRVEPLTSGPFQTVFAAADAALYAAKNSGRNRVEISAA